jgi:hypothetical protein
LVKRTKTKKKPDFAEMFKTKPILSMVAIHFALLCFLQAKNKATQLLHQW